MIGKTKELVFIPATCNGVRAEMDGRFIHGQWFTSIGHGFGENLFATRLALSVTVARKAVKAYANLDFKKALIEINPRVEARRNLLEATVPEKVTVRKLKSKRGLDYYVIDDADLTQWLERIAEEAKNTKGEHEND